MNVTYRTMTVGDVEVFYREAGSPSAPVILLLHGFPTAGHMFRDLIQLLAPRYRVIAPDLPGFGNTKAPPRGKFDYTFDNLASVISRFIDALELRNCALYVFDYGAPTGYRIALAHPERVTAIVSQNGNAYLEGFSRLIGASRRLSAAMPARVAGRICARHCLSCTARRRRDPARSHSRLRTNPALYPSFQASFRDRQPPLLAAWGKNDPFFLPAGALAYKRDLPNAEVHLLDAGRFALETHAEEIGQLMLKFLGKQIA